MKINISNKSKFAIAIMLCISIAGAIDYFIPKCTVFVGVVLGVIMAVLFFEIISITTKEVGGSDGEN